MRRITCGYYCTSLCSRLLVLSPERQLYGVCSLTFSGIGPQDQPGDQWGQVFFPSQWHLDVCEQAATRYGRRRSPGGHCAGQHRSLSICGGLGGPWTTRRCHSAERTHTLSEEARHLAPGAFLKASQPPPVPYLPLSSPLTSTLLPSSTHNLFTSSSVPGIGLGWFPWKKRKSSFSRALHLGLGCACCRSFRLIEWMRRKVLVGVIEISWESIQVKKREIRSQNEVLLSE